ncbi:MAG TPA: DRTGG domain-containing protein [Candidatus Saccharimonadales bacterium]|nr:DRTGG domain-containing protein [Candidatus Saccharimonadales bacterium]
MPELLERRMLLADVLPALDAEVVCGARPALQAELTSCFAADLMSEVLAFCAPGALLVTGLANVQAVHTADVADLQGVLFVNGKRPGADAIQVAERRGIPLLTTRLTMFAVCGILFARGLRPAAKH